MDMSMSDMSDMSMTATPTSTMATGMSGMSMSATATGAMASGTMSMHSMSMGGSCKISMLWNWNVMDTCFLSSSWHITSKGMFAGSCIGVILLVITLEFLRRAGKEYDRFILAQYTRSLGGPAQAPASSRSSSNDVGKAAASSDAVPCAAATTQTFRPNLLQQAIRALLHMLQFAVAYFIMLLAMYYNGYIIICIFIGAYLGYFIFGWESFNIRRGGQDRMQEEVTVCCG